TYGYTSNEQYCGETGLNSGSDKRRQKAALKTKSGVSSQKAKSEGVRYIEVRNGQQYEEQGASCTRGPRDSGRSEFAGAGIQVRRLRAALHRPREGLAHLGRRWK